MAEMASKQVDKGQMNEMWDASGSQQQQMPDPMMQGSMGFRQQPWLMNRGPMPMYQPTASQQENLIKQVPKEDVKEEESKKDDGAKAATNSMIDVLKNSDNPKFRNSKFLKFIKKVNEGAYEIKDKELVKNEDKLK